MHGVPALHRALHADKGLSMAVTDSAKQRLVALQQEQVAALEEPEESAATIDIARISKDEMGVRPLPIIGEYGTVSPLVWHPHAPVAASLRQRVVRLDRICNFAPANVDHRATSVATNEVWMQELNSVPVLGANGVFQTMRMPSQGGEAIILPRWNILALASKPAVLSVPDVAAVPEIAQSFPKPTAAKVRQTSLYFASFSSILLASHHLHHLVR